MNHREALATSPKSVATLLYSLRELGYRSRPQWQRFRRIGSVTAERRANSWS
jgi:hypothetical protein